MDDNTFLFTEFKSQNLTSIITGLDIKLNQDLSYTK